MLFIFSFFCLIVNIKSKTEDLYKIQKGIISNLTKIYFDLKINGTNEYIYKLESKNIFYKTKRTIFSNRNHSFTHLNPKITILFSFSMYQESSNVLELYSYPNEEVITDRIIVVNINFEYLKYFQQYKDFTFNMTYQINNFSNDINIFYDNLEEIDLFNNLIYNEKNILYDNETLYDYSKKIIFKRLIEEMYKNLIYYPECEQLYYFKSLYNYFFMQEFKDGNYFCMYYYGNDLVSSPKITNFSYNEIIKINETLILKDIKIDLNFTATIQDYYKDEYLDTIEKGTLYLDYFKIDENLDVTFGKNIEKEIYDEKCYFELFKIIINKTISALKN